jgi:hypothetical protein
MGDLYAGEKLYEEALGSYKKALSLYSAGNSSGAGHVTFMMGQVYSRLGLYKDAQSSLEMSLVFYERENDQANIAIVKPALRENARLTIPIKADFRLRVFLDSAKLAPFITGSNFIDLVNSREAADVTVEQYSEVVRVDNSKKEPLARFLKQNEKENDEDMQDALFQKLLDAWNAKFFRVILDEKNAKPGLEIRLSESKTSVPPGKELPVEIRTNLSGPHYIVIQSSDGSVRIKPAINNSAQIPPGAGWQLLDRISFPPAEGTSVLGVLALKEKVALDALSNPPAFEFIGQDNLLEAASVSINIEERPGTVAGEFNAIVSETQGIYQSLLRSRRAPDASTLFNLFWSRGLAFHSVFQRRGRQTKLDALNSIRATLTKYDGATAVLFYSLRFGRRDPPEVNSLGHYYDEKRATSSELRVGKLRAWLIGRDGIIAYGSTRVSPWDISQSLQAIHQSMGVYTPKAKFKPASRAVIVREGVTSPAKSFEEAAGNLSRIVFPGKIAAQVGGVKNLVVVPILGLGSIPFAALRPIPAAPQLVETTNITIAPSLFDLNRHAPRWNPRFKSPLIVGGADFSLDKEFSFSLLPGARTEAIAVAGFLRTSPLLDDNATLKAVKRRASRADLLYFATHGVSDPDDPLDGSFLALTSTQNVKGRWTAYAIQHSPLKARLAVLSACRTGLGKEHDGGIIGLARAFTLAGVPRVAISLWSIDDYSTVPLMKSFVANLRIQLPAEALRRAMLTIREKDPDPSHWAAFVIFGVP